MDEISIVGSIGVVGNWVGFGNFLKKHKINSQNISSNK